MTTGSCPKSNQLLTFCDDCGCLRLRDVTSQLQELFTERSVTSDFCGICNKNVTSEATCQVIVSHKVEDNQTIKHEPDFEAHRDIVNNDDDSGGGIDDDMSNVITKNIKSSPIIVDIPLGDHSIKTSGALDAAASTSLKSVNLNSASGVTKSNNIKARRPKVEATKKKTIQTKFITKGQCEPSPRAKSKKRRVTRIDLGVVKAVNYKSMFEDDKRDNVSDEGGGLEEGEWKKPDDDGDDDDNGASDDDSDPCNDDATNDFAISPSSADQKQRKKKPVPSECQSVDLSPNSTFADSVTSVLTSEVIDLMGPITSLTRPFTCKHCFVNPLNKLKGHRRVKGYYDSAIRLMTHLKTYHAEHHPDIDRIMKAPFKCSECDGLYPTLKCVSRHKISKHTEERPHKCKHPGCTVAFRTKHGLKLHSQRHKERQFMCSHCGARFVLNAHLQEHTKSVHLKLMPFTCTHCGKSFARKAKLKVHVDRMHLKLKPFVCDKCGLAFADSTDLRCHTRYHTGEKPYRCDQCDYRCIRADYLWQHKRKHTGEKPYHCELCSRDFRHRTQLVVHQKKQHGGVYSNVDSEMQQMMPPVEVNNSNNASLSSGAGLSANEEWENKTAVQFLNQNITLHHTG